MISAYFVSDLHLFSRRSLAARHMTALHRAAAASRLMVLGGDIFDFKWSTTGCHRATAVAAIDWLRELTAAHDHCQFCFLLGNHDSVPAFVDRLADFSAECENLNWFPHYLRVANTICLHGDVSDQPTTQPALEQRRRRWAAHTRHPPAVRHHMYDAIIRLRLHRVVNIVMHQNRHVAERIIYYLNDLGHGPESGIQDVYFGHTHVAVERFLHAGVRFHNGGAPMQGLNFRLVPLQLPADWRATQQGG